jgi:hypothetical protein
MKGEEVSTVRLYLMRTIFLLNFALLGLDVWPALIRHEGPWEPMHGVAVSFWAALAGLSGLGLRYPLKMLPLLFLQFTYKLLWLAAVALPQGFAGKASGLLPAMAIGAALDLIAIPWPYALAQYARQPGDRWK